MNERKRQMLKLITNYLNYELESNEPFEVPPFSWVNMGEWETQTNLAIARDIDDDLRHIIQVLSEI